MIIDKDFIVAIFEADTIDKASEGLFEHFGPCVRSEYILDKENLVDLDWENIGLVMTLSSLGLSQIYLSVNEDSVQPYQGWMGEDVNSSSCQDDTIFEKTETYSTFSVKYHFNEDKSLQSVVILKK